jgi:hypothetical protein
VVTLELRLRADAIALRPLRVVAERVEPMFMSDIRRRQAMGFGKLVTREELDQRAGSDLRSVLEDVPGVQMVTVGSGRDMIPLVQTRAGVQTGRSCFAALYVNGSRQYPPRDITGPLGKQNMIDRVQDFFVLIPSEIEAIEVYRGLTEVGEFGDEFGVCGVVAVWLRTGHERRAEEPVYGTMRLAPSQLHFSVAGLALSGVHAPGNGVALETALEWRLMRFVSVGLHARYSGHQLPREAVQALTQGLDAQQYVLPTGSQPMALFAVGADTRVSPMPAWRIRPVFSGRVQLTRRTFDIGDAVRTDRSFDQASNGRGVGMTIGVETTLRNRLSMDFAIGRDWLDFSKYPNLDRPWRPTAAKWDVTALRLGLSYMFSR